MRRLHQKRNIVNDKLAASGNGRLMLPPGLLGDQGVENGFQSLLRAGGSANTSSRMRARLSAPCASTRSAPKAAAMAGTAAPSAAVRLREIWSASIRVAPRSFSLAATVLCRCQSRLSGLVGRGKEDAGRAWLLFTGLRSSEWPGDPTPDQASPTPPARKGPNGT